MSRPPSAAARRLPARPARPPARPAPPPPRRSRPGDGRRRRRVSAPARRGRGRVAPAQDRPARPESRPPRESPSQGPGAARSRGERDGVVRERSSSRRRGVTGPPGRLFAGAMREWRNGIRIGEVNMALGLAKASILYAALPSPATESPDKCPVNLLPPQAGMSPFFADEPPARSAPPPFGTVGRWGPVTISQSSAEALSVWPPPSGFSSSGPGCGSWSSTRSRSWPGTRAATTRASSMPGSTTSPAPEGGPLPRGKGRPGAVRRRARDPPAPQREADRRPR